uniref:Lipase n=1 Tax=Culicoides sonorensis TaxID=179676 RepID=A0A336L176_CULSO
MDGSFSLVILIIFSAISDTSSNGILTTKTIKKFGYPNENHKLTTDDGYKLSLHRIPSKRSNGNVTREPVLLIHGLLCSSSMWVVSPFKNKSALAFNLADDAYDVWMVNVRGTTLSRGHKKKNISETAYWDFSFHEIGLYDISKTIDFVLHKTGSNNLNVICHSQGCTSLLVLLSLRPEYNEKVSSAYLSTAPVFLHHTTGMLARIVGTELEEVVYSSLKNLGIHMFQVVNSFLTESVRNLCTTAYDFCSVMFAANVGPFMKSFNEKRMFFFLLDDVIDNSSVKQFTHYLQLIRNKRFRMFDYGYYKNKAIYRKSIPPEYNLKKVAIPITIMRPISDPFSTREDLRLLMKKLSTVQDMIELPGNHIDYFYDPRTLNKMKTHIIESFKK